MHGDSNGGDGGSESDVAPRPTHTNMLHYV